MKLDNKSYCFRFLKFLNGDIADDWKSSDVDGAGAGDDVDGAGAGDDVDVDGAGAGDDVDVDGAGAGDDVDVDGSGDDVDGVLYMLSIDIICDIGLYIVLNGHGRYISMTGD